MSIIQGSAMQGASRGFYPKEIEGSLRFNDDDSAYLSWTPDSAGNRKTWTFSCWVKRGAVTGGNQDLFAPNIADQTQIWILSGGAIRFYQQNTSVDLQTTAVFRDHSAWYHFVFEVDTTQATASDRIKIYANGEQITAFDTANYPSQNADMTWNTTNEHRIGGASLSYLDGYLAEVFFIDGTAHDADDFGETKNGVWVPKNITASNFTMGTNGFYLNFQDDAEVEAFNTTLYRGTGAAQSVTGVGFSPDLVWIKNRNNTGNHKINDSVRGAGNALEAQNTAAEQNDTSHFTSFDSDGFTLGSGALSYNGSGRTYVAWAWDAGANNASTGHSSVTYTGNGGTQNVSGFPFSPDLVWIKERSSTSSNVLFDTVRGVTNGLFSDSTSAESSTSTQLQVFDKYGFRTGSSGGTNESGQTYVAWAWDAGDGDPVSNTDGSITSTVKTNGDFSILTYTGTGANATVGHGLSGIADFVIAKDRDNSNDWICWHQELSDGTQHLKLNATEAASANATYWNSTEPTSSVISLGSNSKTNGSGADFVIYAWRNVTGKQKFSSYTGTGSAPSALINTGFRPGFLMIKEADGVDGWGIYDGSRNPLNPVSYLLQAQDSGAESSATANYVDFESNGFKVCTGGSNGNFLNESGKTYIYAAFAGSYSDFITDYNTDGSIDSRVKASDTTGFSICSFTTPSSGSFNFGHGLSSAPDFILSKSRTGAYNWPVYHSSVGAGNYLLLNSTAASAASTTVWGNTTPSSSVVYSDAAGLVGNQDYIAYCWTATANRSAFGSYTGTGAIGNTTTTGFKPAVVMLKRTDSTGNWNIFDNTRSTDGNAEELLFPNSSSAEITSSEQLVFLSNGFEPNVDNHNLSGATYIYAAFADTREAAFWLDQSSNDNDWQPVNLDHNDTVSDSPTDNFATFNALHKTAGTDYRTLSDGNLKVTGTSTTNNGNAHSTIAVSEGKYYVEITCTDYNSSYTVYPQLGVQSVESAGRGEGQVGYRADSYAYFANGQKATTNGTGQTYGDSWTTGDTIGIALDLDNGAVYFSKNGTWQNSGDPSSGASRTGAAFTWTPDGTEFLFSVAVYTTDNELVANFGQQPFKYSPPE